MKQWRTVFSIQHPVRKIGVMLALFLAVVACRPAPSPEPASTSTAAPTRALRAGSNQNAELLNSLQAALSAPEFGLAPLLLMDGTRLAVETAPGGDVIRLDYPRQPANPLEWPGVDSFVLAYAAHRFLSGSPLVRQITIGQFDLAAGIDGSPAQITHTAVWVRFADGSQAVVDLTPLAVNFAARHPIGRFLSDEDMVTREFSRRREGVPLNVLQPLKVVEQDGELFLVTAWAQVEPRRYILALQVHSVQTGTPMRPLALGRGVSARLEMDRTGFEALRRELLDGGPEMLAQRPDLLERAGSGDPHTNRVLDGQLDLLWQMATRLEPPPAPAGDTPPTATPTPAPTPTPSPTPTPTAVDFPLLVS